jgi:hypothetical protein
VEGFHQDQKFHEEIYHPPLHTMPNQPDYLPHPPRSQNHDLHGLQSAAINRSFRPEVVNDFTSIPSIVGIAGCAPLRVSEKYYIERGSSYDHRITERRMAGKILLLLECILCTSYAQQSVSFVLGRDYSQPKSYLVVFTFVAAEILA